MSILAVSLLFFFSKAGSAWAETGVDLSGKTVLWVDSYYSGYEWSDGIELGIRKVLAGTGVELETVHMDTKRNSDEAFKKRSGRQVMEQIREISPDLVIASDDNAQEYLVAPYLKNTDMPVIFCGVDRPLDAYGYPTENISGMREKDSIEALVLHLKRLSRGGRLAYLSGDTASDRRHVEFYNEHYFNGQLKGYFAGNLEEFTDFVLRAQYEADILLIMNNAGIPDWDSQTVERFVIRHNKLPTGSVMAHMKEYAMITLGKDPEEQGKFAANAALLVLSGTPVSAIPVTENSRVVISVNLKMARAASIVIPVNTLKTAQEIIGKDAY